MIINSIYERQNLLLLQLVSVLVGLRTYQHPYSFHAEFHVGLRLVYLCCTSHIERHVGLPRG
jgi:hypothetical protein